MSEPPEQPPEHPNGHHDRRGAWDVPSGGLPHAEDVRRAEELAGLHRDISHLGDRISGLQEALEGLYHRGDPDDPASHRGELQQLEDAISHLGKEVADIGEAVAPADQPDSGARLLCWVDLDQEQAQEAWRDLVGWLRKVLLVRYPELGEFFTECWYRHPSLIENLHWFHAAWVRTYHGGADSRPTQAAEWHARWMPHITLELKALKDTCGYGHVEPSGRISEGPDAVLDDGQLQDYIAADIAARPVPAPPEDESNAPTPGAWD